MITDKCQPQLQVLKFGLQNIVDAVQQKGGYQFPFPSTVYAPPPEPQIPSTSARLDTTNLQHRAMNTIGWPTPLRVDRVQPLLIVKVQTSDGAYKLASVHALLMCFVAVHFRSCCTGLSHTLHHIVLPRTPNKPCLNCRARALGVVFAP